jgi:hypothetical protein
MSIEAEKVPKFDEEKQQKMQKEIQLLKHQF